MDTKSASILGLCILLAALILASAPRLLPSPARGGVGRYQFIATTGVNCFVLDTQTGRLWQKFVPHNEGPGRWEEAPTPWMQATDKPTP